MKISSRKAYALFLIFCLISIVLLIALSLFYGSTDISVQTVLEALSGGHNLSQAHIAISELRLPRTIADLLCGACLAAAGAMMQGVTRNPLADSSLLGINAGASFAIAICLAFFPGLAFGWMVAGAFGGAAIACLVLFLLLKAGHGSASPVKLILAGSAVSIFLSALSNGLSIFANVGQDLSLWNYGGTAGVRMDQLKIAAPVMILACLMAWMSARKVGALSLGIENARALGVQVERSIGQCLIIVLLLAGSAVSLCGPVAFVGLLVPALVRLFAGSDYRRVIPGSIAAGAAAMLAADLISRRINPPAETPVGLIFGVIGVPLFIYLVRKGAAGHEQA